MGTTDQAAVLAQKHWNETPLFLSEEERYRIYPWLPEAAEFTKHANEDVLEVGCGTGCDLLQFAKYGARAHGIDITDEHLALAQKRVAGAAVVKKADGRTIPYPDKFFDYVYSHGVIHHSDDPQTICKEIVRVLKPGGRFNIHLYAKYSWFPVALMVKYGRDWKNHVENSTVPVHIDLYTAGSFRALFPGIKVEFTKYESPVLPGLFGWYLVGKGTKPE